MPKSKLTLLGVWKDAPGPSGRCNQIKESKAVDLFEMFLIKA